MNDNAKYYEKLLGSKIESNKLTDEKIEIILKQIPDDVETILDIGCGNGNITNRLNEVYNVIGVDRNHVAIENVIGKKIVSSCDNVNVSDSSFDMVFSSELLEHLEDKIFLNTIKEIKRISKKYIFLTFPNNEVVEKDFVKCNYCNCVFNKSYHLQGLGVEKMKTLFPEYNILNNFVFGNGKRGYNRFLLKFKHKYLPSTSWVPKFWTKNSKRKTMCPKCEKVFVYEYKFNLLGSFCDLLNMFLSPHKPYWLFIIMEKK